MLAGMCGIVACGRGEVSVMTYNVAGLPEDLSASHPAENTKRIGALLNDYDVVLLQEDFAYHTELVGAAHHAYRFPSEPDDAHTINATGLARFSRDAAERRVVWVWEACHGTAGSGSDCLASKGFAVAEHEIRLMTGAVLVDIYNLHMDAGENHDDERAREAQAAQLMRAIDARSATKAIIVAGDTNADSPWDGAMAMLAAAGFVDVCVALDCADPDRVDRVLYRSSAFVTLKPSRWRTPEEFVTEEGQPLSDHRPVAVDFEVSVDAVR